MVVYWMMILWLKQSDTCVNVGLLNDDTLIKISSFNKPPLTQVSLCFNQYIIIQLTTIDTGITRNVSMVVYWMMISWLKQSHACVNGGLLNDDILIKENVSMVVYWMMIFWLKQIPPLTHLFWSKYHHSINHHWHRYHSVLIKISSFNKPPLTQVSLCFNQYIIIQLTTIDTGITLF
jgi:hypothetical protein